MQIIKEHRILQNKIRLSKEVNRTLLQNKMILNKEENRILQNTMILNKEESHPKIITMEIMTLVMMIISMDMKTMTFKASIENLEDIMTINMVEWINISEMMMIGIIIGLILMIRGMTSILIIREKILRIEENSRTLMIAIKALMTMIYAVNVTKIAKMIVMTMMIVVTKMIVGMMTVATKIAVTNVNA